MTARPPRRPQRADARRNRAHVLEVARAAFASDGTALPMDELARRAGVGVGTLYRHFPTKEALLSAIVAERITTVAAHARDLAHAADPGAAFFDLLRRMAREGTDKRDLVDALAGAGIDVRTSVAGPSRALRTALIALLRRAQAAGSVRTDVTVDDILALLAALAFASRRGSARSLDVVLDGLRGSGST
ncbi:MAG TPA: helix-turn-helix domain-containing protein [Kofleriaceae bacterium]|nr:helix-turn-helix domain-containing protein [Kofleriaceae bacterium]